MSTFRDMGRVLREALDQHAAPNINTATSIAATQRAEEAMLDEALRMRTSPDGIGHAIGMSLVRRYGAATAYRISDAVARGIQDAMKGGV